MIHFFSPSWLKKADRFSKGVRKFIAYQRDLIPGEKLTEVNDLKSAYDAALKAKDRPGLGQPGKETSQGLRRCRAQLQHLPLQGKCRGHYRRGDCRPRYPACSSPSKSPPHPCSRHSTGSSRPVSRENGKALISCFRPFNTRMEQPQLRELCDSRRLGNGKTGGIPPVFEGQLFHPDRTEILQRKDQYHLCARPSGIPGSLLGFQFPNSGRDSRR